MRETFNACGHPNINPSHKTTLMITRDEDLTRRGDCIVSVRAGKGLRDLDPRLKEAIRSSKARIRLSIEVGNLTFSVSGNGDPRLTLSHPTDIVARKSSYVCDRTLMINADKAACDLDSSIVRLLQDAKKFVKIEISAESVTQTED